MLEQTEITEQFQALLEMEKQAESFYAQQLAQASDGAVRKQLDQLRRDKARHIRLIERLLEIVN